VEDGDIRAKEVKKGLYLYIRLVVIAYERGSVF
jgi:hypothetical protein